MTSAISLSLDHEAALQQLVDFSERDPEGFRLQAAVAYAEFSPQDRAVMRNLETDTWTAYAVLEKWQAALQPLLGTLQANQQRPAFRTAIAKYLVISHEQANDKVSEFITARQREARIDFTNELYPPVAQDSQDKYRKSRAHAYSLFEQPPDEIEALQGRYVQYLLYHRAAELQSITITDVHAPWLKRRHALQKANSERKRASKREYDRLRTIQAELSQLSQMYDGLLGRVLEKDWDLIVVIGLRNQYEKQLQKLEDNDAKSPLKRLEVFEKITKDFRDSQVEKMALEHPALNSLSAARNFAEAINTLLLEIFDLSNAEKNQLLTLTKQARELAAEKDHILQLRSRREHILKKPLAIY